MQALPNQWPDVGTLENFSLKQDLNKLQPLQVATTGCEFNWPPLAASTTANYAMVWLGIAVKLTPAQRQAEFHCLNHQFHCRWRTDLFAGLRAQTTAAFQQTKEGLAKRRAAGKSLEQAAAWLRQAEHSLSLRQEGFSEEPESLKNPTNLSLSRIWLTLDLIWAASLLCKQGKNRRAPVLSETPSKRDACLLNEIGNNQHVLNRGNRPGTDCQKRFGC